MAAAKPANVLGGSAGPNLLARRALKGAVVSLMISCQVRSVRFSSVHQPDFPHQLLLLFFLARRLGFGRRCVSTRRSRKKGFLSVRYSTTTGVANKSYFLR